jgi:hypothetical protein
MVGLKSLRVCLRDTHNVHFLVRHLAGGSAGLCRPCLRCFAVHFQALLHAQDSQLNNLSIANVTHFAHHRIMPRPKVQDSQRRRAAEACPYCRATKKKCSGSSPCTQCQQRGMPEQCLITNLPRGFRPRVRRGAQPSPKAVGTPWLWDADPQASLPTPLCDTMGASPPADTYMPGLLTLDSNTPPVNIFGTTPLDVRDESGEGKRRLAGYTATTGRTRNAISLDPTVILPRPQMLRNYQGERGMFSRHPMKFSVVLSRRTTQFTLERLLRLHFFKQRSILSPRKLAPLGSRTARTRLALRRPICQSQQRTLGTSQSSRK